MHKTYSYLEHFPRSILDVFVLRKTVNQAKLVPFVKTFEKKYIDIKFLILMKKILAYMLIKAVIFQSFNFNPLPVNLLLLGQSLYKT